MSLIPSWALAAGFVLLAELAAGADRKADVDRLVQPVIDSGYAKAIVVGLYENGKPRVFGYGQVSELNAKAPDGKTVFEIGSVTKVFTGLLLAEMTERKMVALDDPVRKYLPEGKVPAPKEGEQEIRLVDLSSQTSGLPRMPNNFRPKDPTNPYADYDAEKLYEFLRQQTLVRKPDAAYLYSNLGVGLLGQALALRAGKSYEEAVREMICGPLGLQDTRVKLTGEMRARLASGHNGDGDPVPNWDLDALAGAGALRSTTDDLLKFIAAQINPTGELAPAINLSHEVRAKTGTPPGSIALNWHILPDGKWYWHNGGTGGYSSHIGFNTEAKAGFVLLVSSAPGVMDQIAARLRLIETDHPWEPLKLRKAIPLDTKLLDRYAGVYELARVAQLAVRRDGNALVGQITGQGIFSCGSRCSAGS